MAADGIDGPAPAPGSRGMLARTVAAIANLLLAALAWLFDMPMRGLPLVGALVGLSLVLTLAIDLALRLRSVRPRNCADDAQLPS